VGKKAGLTTEDVIGAAASLADAHGLRALTLARLADELGIKPPSLYNHVDGLEGLHLELAMLAGDELTVEVGRAVEGRDAEDAVRAVCHVLRDFARKHPGLYEAHARGTRAPIPVILEVLSHFSFDRDDTVHAIRVFRSTVHGFIELERELSFNLPLPVDDSFDRAVEIFLAGIRGWRR
jgi:AcrR family transcriptional regulator